MLPPGGDTGHTGRSGTRPRFNDSDDSVAFPPPVYALFYEMINV